jgi:hypothetical protein
LFIAAGDVSRDRFVDDQPLDYMLVTPNVDAANAMLGGAAAAGLIERKLRSKRLRGAVNGLRDIYYVRGDVLLNQEYLSPRRKDRQGRKFNFRNWGFPEFRTSKRTSKSAFRPWRSLRLGERYS